MKLLDYQLQSNVARLLSRENITVTHRNVKTASFDLRNRVMTLPLWKDHGKVVYDMLIAHEVGHALEDDQDLFIKYLEDNGFSSVPDPLNVIDDIRIERKVQAKYPGLPKIFHAAYKILVENGIFNVDGRDLTKLNFVDRLNLYAKVGTHVQVPLNDEELEFYNRCYVAETTQDVLDLYDEFRELIKKPENPQQEIESNEDDEDITFPQNPSNENGEEEDGENEISSFDPDAEETEEETSRADSNQGADETSETLEEFNNNISERDTGNDWGYSRFNRDNVPMMMPLKSSVDQMVTPYQEILEDRNVYTPYASLRYDPEFISEALAYKKDVKKKVGVLIREFERRKAAYQYSRAQEARSGTIDVTKLHKYKFDDQIFNSVTRLANSKNHGMIFYIDYSGSMAHVLKDVIDQTLNLVYFCKKMSIPFEVYSYTTNTWGAVNKFDQADNEIILNNIRLNHLFSSDMSKGEYELAFDQMFMQYRYLKRDGFSWQMDSIFGRKESLGGTPLNALIAAANHHCNDFQKKHRVEKLNVIMLTDGDSEQLATKCATNGMTTFEGKKLSFKKKTCMAKGEGNGVSLNAQYTMRDQQQEELLKLLRKKATVIGMFLPNSMLGAKRKICLAEKNVGTLQKKWSKTKFLELPECGAYDSLMILPTDVEIKNDDLEFESQESISDSTSAQSKLARQFTKMNKSNRQSRVILTKFAEIIA
jgi:hypothetical protein